MINLLAWLQQNGIYAEMAKGQNNIRTCFHQMHNALYSINSKAQKTESCGYCNGFMNIPEPERRTHTTARKKYKPFEKPTSVCQNLINFERIKAIHMPAPEIRKQEGPSSFLAKFTPALTQY